jgi:DNA-binding PadR family transcriptional regulator
MEYKASRHSTRGFPVEFAVLGFLIEESMHGYALRSRITEGLGPLWQVASSQMYQVLRRLEDRGLVRPADEAASGGPARRVYYVTADGMLCFREWARAPVDAMRNVRVEFAAKLYFLRRLEPGGVSVLIDRQLRLLENISETLSDESRRGSDDPILNAAWLEMQQSTVRNFARWLNDHRHQLEIDKEKEA